MADIAFIPIVLVLRRQEGDDKIIVKRLIELGSLLIMLAQKYITLGILPKTLVIPPLDYPYKMSVKEFHFLKKVTSSIASRTWFQVSG